MERAWKLWHTTVSKMVMILSLSTTLPSLISAFIDLSIGMVKRYFPSPLGGEGQGEG
jgi:hypothetical protein